MDKSTEAVVYARISLKLNEMLYESGDISAHEYNRVNLTLTERLTSNDRCVIINRKQKITTRIRTDTEANPNSPLQRA